MSDTTTKANLPQPMAEALNALNSARRDLQTKDPDLAKQIGKLLSDAREADKLNDKAFRHEIAYAVRDAEKTLGHQLPLSATTRAEIERLANSAPGLENERMAQLLTATVTLIDKTMLTRLRTTAAEIGRQADQDTPSIRQQLDQLERDIREAKHTKAPEKTPAPAAASAGAQGQPGERADASQRPAGQNGEPMDQVREHNVDGARKTVDGSFRNSSNMPAAPTIASNFGARLEAFRRRNALAAETREIEEVLKMGQQAVAAIDRFRTHEALVLNRINEAARSDPNGIAGVISEMRRGGRYEGLRQQFNTAIHAAGGAAAYDKAAEALAVYGAKREGIASVISRRPDAENLLAKFNEIDADLGEKASAIPSRRDGKNMMDDIIAGAKAIIEKAVETVRTVFNADARQRASAGPSPS
jgi:hypothetical protein